MRLRAGKSALIVLAGLALALSSPVLGEELPPAPTSESSQSAQASPAYLSPQSAQAAQVMLPPGTLRNIDYLPKLQTSRPPARPRKFLRRRNLKTMADRDEKYVQLLLVSVGFVSMFIVILALRSMPPAKKTA